MVCVAGPKESCRRLAGLYQGRGGPGAFGSVYREEWQVRTWKEQWPNRSLFITKSKPLQQLLMRPHAHKHSKAKPVITFNSQQIKPFPNHIIFWVSKRFQRNNRTQNLNFFLVNTKQCLRCLHSYYRNWRYKILKCKKQNKSTIKWSIWLSCFISRLWPSEM